MVETLKLDSTGDIEFNPDTATLGTTRGTDALTQKLFLLMNINHGELSWNDDIGMDMLEVRINSDNPDLLQSMINDYLTDMLGDQFVNVQINSIDVDRANRVNHVSASVTLNIDGTQQVVEADFGGDEDSTDS